MSVSIYLSQYFVSLQEEWVTLQSPQDEWYQISKKKISRMWLHFWNTLWEILLPALCTRPARGLRWLTVSRLTILLGLVGYHIARSSGGENCLLTSEPERGLTGVVARQWPESDWLRLRYSSPVLCAVLLYYTITTITLGHTILSYRRHFCFLSRVDMFGTMQWYVLAHRYSGVEMCSLQT